MPDPRDLWAYEYKGRQALSYLVTADANARAARRDAAAALALAKEQALQGRPLTEAETEAVVKKAIAGGVDIDVTVTVPGAPKENQ